MCGLLIFTQISSRFWSTAKHTASVRERRANRSGEVHRKKKKKKKTGKKNPVQPEDDGLGVFPVPFVSQRSLSAGSTQTTAAEGASLGSIKCQTDHIDAAAVSSAVINIRTNPDSSQKSQWRGRRGRDARSIRALIGWEEPSVSSKESLFSSVSSPAGNEARCKKYPH